MWETPPRLPRGPSAATAATAGTARQIVERVQQVLRRRDAGVRLEVAIAGVGAGGRRQSRTRPVRPRCSRRCAACSPTSSRSGCKKATLLALSWAIEDECCARAERPMIFGAFQKERYYRAAEERWTELARIARSTMVFAAFDEEPRAGRGHHVFVHLPEDAPMRREWAVVCDAPTTRRC